VEIVDKLKRPGVPIEWLPVPSNLPTETDRREVEILREELSKGGAAPLVGHFGTYGGPLRTLLQEVVELSRPAHPGRKFVFIGRGSREFLNVLEDKGTLARGSAAASGGLGPAAAACWIKACDVMVQPYPDGASSRRGTLMAALALGKATVSNVGQLSDTFWKHSKSLCLAEGPYAGEIVAEVSKVLADTQLRNRLEADAAKFYADRFRLEKTIERLEAIAHSKPGTIALP